MRVPEVVRRFVGVGVLNTLIDIVVFLLLRSTLGVFWANFVSTSCGMACSFVLNGRWTFGAQRLSVRQLVAFLGINAVTMWLLQPLIITGVSRTAEHVLGDWVLIPLGAKVAAIACCLVVNFVGYRFFVWPQGKGVAGSAAAGHAESGTTADPR